MKTIATTTCVVNEKTEKKQKNEMRKKLTNIVNKNKNLKKKILAKCVSFKALKDSQSDRRRQMKMETESRGKLPGIMGDLQCGLCQ